MAQCLGGGGGLKILVEFRSQFVTQLCQLYGTEASSSHWS